MPSIADWHANPELAELLERMTRDGMIGWRGRGARRRPFMRSYGRTAQAALAVLREAEIAAEQADNPKETI